MSKNPQKESLAKVDVYNRAERDGAISLKYEKFLCPEGKSDHLANTSQLKLQQGHNSGVFFGRASNDDEYFGMPEGCDGNLVIIGGNGSGKSRGIAMPTLKTWRSAIVATDIKSELSAQYAKLVRSGEVTRPYIVFDPTKLDTPSYDPFWWLQNDNENNEVANIWDIVRAIVPLSPEDKQPFWVESEQGLFAAALLECFHCGLSFSQSICFIVSKPAAKLVEALMLSRDVRVRMMLGEIAKMREETLACIDRGLRNKLMVLATDPQISHALRGERETANCFSWDDLQDMQIFIGIPADKIDQWNRIVNLMYAQLFRYLERRPEQYTPAAEEHPQLLVLMDEFTRFGKLNGITSALSTLRSKKVNLALFVQSIAQIDRYYGDEERRIIFDNCQWKVILRANDPDTQQFICKGIGTSIHRQHSIGKQMDRDGKKTGFSIQISETQDWIVAPHELSILQDVLLLTPAGFSRIQKHLLISDTMVQDSQNGTNGRLEMGGNILLRENRNGETTMKTIEQRTQEAKRQFKESEYLKRREERQAQEEKRKKENRLKKTIGELVLRYFPELLKIAQDNGQQQCNEQLANFEAILVMLADSPDVVQALRDRAKQRSGQEVC